ncbi:hypothetical protein BDW02DRAFT_573353 [Decorospora gaudefroyi]|uniref:C2H2-type domain-containing protein n=1 Tax=Decorospora gaudefroyi TaxID=184978 RepID=A0A6A5K6L9_9PLEO|nr:hypothetical protein BDW02DRAFT_573353 [Decorospora gaudefroyi]
MEAMTLSGYTQVSLPKLTTSKELCRRDSLSSSRTRDSGYNSDLDSLSPLELVRVDQDIPLPPLPCMPSILANNRNTLSRGYSNHHKALPTIQTDITSVPAQSVPKRTAFCTRPLETVFDCPPRKAIKDCLASQDEEIERWIKDNLPSRNKPKERVSSIASLSSTSSCDMYTSTDVSDDDQELHQGNNQVQYPRSVIKTIELIIQKVEVNLRDAAHKQCAGSSTSHARGGAIYSSGLNSRKRSLCSGAKRKFRLEGSPPPEDDHPDGPNKRRRGSATNTDDSETGARFACPFYKHDPDRYRNRRTCPGPGWPTVHRMKEHLYRSHSQPIFCPICYETFKSDKEQSNHVRLQQCQRSSPQQIEGIDRETVWTLRKRTTALRLEEDKWRDVYQVLFPDIAAADIPSPFYDCDSPSEASRRFRRELLRRVQQELLVEAGQVPGHVEQQILQRVAHIIRRCEHDLLNQARPPPTPSFNSDRRSSASSLGSSYQPTPMPTPILPEVHGPIDSVPFGSILPLAYASEPAVDFAPVAWDDQSYNAFSLGIDWEGVFPPGPAPEAQYAGGGEAISVFAAPMWT